MKFLDVLHKVRNITIFAYYKLNHSLASGLTLPLSASSEMQQYHQDYGPQEEVVSLPRNRLTPPRLLICYSSYDGPAHLKAIMQLGSFIQQHMATQVRFLILIHNL